MRSSAGMESTMRMTARLAIGGSFLVEACLLAACSSEESQRAMAPNVTVVGDDDDANAGLPDGGGGDAWDPEFPGPDVPAPLPKASCKPADSGATTTVATPSLLVSLADRWHEAWLASPAVVDLDGDGKNEIIVPRDDLLIVWHLDGSVVFKVQTAGRIWASPVVADLVPSRPGLEVAAAARGKIFAWDAKGAALQGFPVDCRDELRSLAAGDIDGDGSYELVAVSSTPLREGMQKDIVFAVRGNGTPVSGFPPNTSGSSQCDESCSVTGGYDQNLALGDVDGDGKLDILAPQDNAYMSLHRGDGFMFDANSIFAGRNKFAGIRFLHDYALAQKGWAEQESVANQAHFTNSAPAIADIDGDGKNELIVLASVQNASQEDRLRGVALWVLNSDGSRKGPWIEPFHVPNYLAGLWDFEGTNVVGATNQVTVADIDPNRKGPEFIFAGFDGRIHCVDAARNELWSYGYTTHRRVLTGGVVVADLSKDGIPEIVFNSYSPDEGLSNLFIVDAAGNGLHKIALPKRGAMPVPTIADVDGNGTLEILVSLKDGEDKTRQVMVYTVPGSTDNCMLWPTGRGNLFRNGYVP